MINIKSDSRKVKKGDIFVALKGISSDGDKYIDSAIKNGASCVVVDNDNKYSVKTIKVSDTRDYLTKYLHDNYSKYLNEMNIIGITGTNGKTTSAYLIYQLLNKLEYKCAYIGTIGYYLEDKVCSLPNTSPDICDLYDMIINAYDNGYKNIVIEASSQGLDMNRFDTINFDYAIFTNLTQDHLDYHHTLENYAKAKKKLFLKLKENGKSIINSDDKYANYFSSNNSVYYGKGANDYKIENCTLGSKTIFRLNIKNNAYDICSPLIGEYNIYNLTCAISLLCEMNVDINKIISVISDVKCPPGRLDIVKFKDNLIVIDYAHTPDAMENVFKIINGMNKKNVYTVFGCTGDRDKLKRPIMMNIALDNSNQVIVTSDDLHDEDFNSIVGDMISNTISNSYEIIADRAKAIERGLNLLKSNDILLILGKGHEEYIIIKDKKIPFNDKEEVKKLIKSSINV